MEQFFFKGQQIQNVYPDRNSKTAEVEIVFVPTDYSERFGKFHDNEIRAKKMRAEGLRVTESQLQSSQSRLSVSCDWIAAVTQLANFKRSSPKTPSIKDKSNINSTQQSYVFAGLT